MKKFFFTLVCLFAMAISFGQTNDYSVGLDTLAPNQTVNVKVSNTPNITVMDKNFLETVSDYKFQQGTLSNELYKLSAKVDQIQNSKALTPTEMLVRNKGFTDEQILKSINKNRTIWWILIAFFSLFYFYVIHPLLEENKLNDREKPFLRGFFFLAISVTSPLLLYLVYLVTTNIFNPNYLVIKDLLNLFG